MFIPATPFEISGVQKLLGEVELPRQVVNRLNEVTITSSHITVQVVQSAESEQCEQKSTEHSQLNKNIEQADL